MCTLVDKTVVVTGAGSGIGAAVARHVASLGAAVHLVGRTEETLWETAASCAGRGAVHVADVRDEAALERVRDAIVSGGGRIDALVTCAAAGACAGPAETTSLEQWREVMSIDVDGVFLSCKVFGAPMLAARYGRIVNLTSFHTTATYPERVAYNAAKSAVSGITRALAVEWGNRGVTVNAVAPGPIRTPRTSWFLSQSPDVERGMLGRTPTVRLGETEDVAHLVAFLISPQARHLTGQEITVDGGWTKCAWWGDHAARER